jgi:hypothetical protein
LKLLETLMPYATSWSLFAVVWLLSLALAWQLWRFHMRGRFMAGYLGLWFGVASAVGLLFMLHPGLPLPAWVLPAAIVGLAVLFTVLSRRHPRLSERVRGATLPEWYGLQVLRAPFGLLILAGGALGVLPRSFAWAAGFGDLAVGVAALLLRRWPGQGRGGVMLATLFTLVGVADLLNAGRLGATAVVPWLAERGLPAFLPMLPFFGVPIFISLHVQTLLHVWRKAPPTPRPAATPPQTRAACSSPTRARR